AAGRDCRFCGQAGDGGGNVRMGGRAGGDGRPHALGARLTRGREARRPGSTGGGARLDASMSTDLFIRRPVMTTLLMAGLLIFGFMAYEQLPASDLPNVDFPVIQVAASLPAASPATMASAVATPLERQFSTIAGI